MCLEVLAVSWKVDNIWTSGMHNFKEWQLHQQRIAISDGAHRLLCSEFLVLQLPTTQAMIQVYWLTAHNPDQADYYST